MRFSAFVALPLLACGNALALYWEFCLPFLSTYVGHFMSFMWLRLDETRHAALEAIVRFYCRCDGER